PEETGDVDQDVVEELREFALVHLQEVPVRGEVVQAHDLHALADPSGQARLLVPREIEAARVLDVLEQRRQSLVRLGRAHRSLPARIIDSSSEAIRSSGAMTSTSPVSMA